MRKNDKSESTERKRVLARVHAEGLEIVSGGRCTIEITGGGSDMTNLAGDNDGCDY